MEFSTPILITGTGSFLTDALTEGLRRLGFSDILCPAADIADDALTALCKKAGYVVHLTDAADPASTDRLLACLTTAGSTAPLFAILPETEDGTHELTVYRHGEQAGSPVFVFRPYVIFGGREDGTLVSALCKAAAAGQPLPCPESDEALPLVYVQDFVQTVVDAYDGAVMCDRSRYPLCRMLPVYEATPAQLAKLVESCAAGCCAEIAPDSLEEKICRTWQACQG